MDIKYIISITILGLVCKSVHGQDQDELNLAHRYSSDFHVSFALIAFTTLVFFLSIFGVSLGMWFMDPGRDSIIYRMTSQRGKKDQ